MKTLLITLFIVISLTSFSQKVVNETKQSPAEICKERGHQLSHSIITKGFYSDGKTFDPYLIDYPDSTVLVEPVKFIQGRKCVRCNEIIWESGTEERTIIWKRKETINNKMSKVTKDPRILD